MLFVSKFAKNTNWKINFYKNRQYLWKMFGWNSRIFLELDYINNIRNRIAHHEPICFGFPICVDTTYALKNYSRMMNLLQWMDIPRLLFFFVNMVQSNLLANFRQLSRVATTNERTVDDSLASQFKDFEDAMQYYTALKAKADVIITRNGKDFTASKIPVMTAVEYLATQK